VLYGGRAKVHTQVGHVTDLVHHGRHLQQRLGRDAAQVKAHAAQGGVALDDDDLEAQVGCAERGAETARAATEQERVAVQADEACEAGRYWIDSCLRFWSKRWGLF